MKQFIVVLRMTEPGADEDWEPRPTTAQEVADYVATALERGGPDVEVYNYFEQEG